MTLNDMLNNRFIEYDGYQFQKLFYEIMRVKYGTDFEMPWPHGNVGDYKCDGYYKPEGAFYACYAPENPSVDVDASSMIQKMNSDINGLKENIKKGIWSFPFLKFVFVVNLKNRNIPPAPLLVEKNKIEADLKTDFGRCIDVVVLTQYDLKIIFNTLEVGQQEFILSKVFLHEENFEFDGAIVSKIIEHFSNTDVLKVGIHDIMEFKDKVKFNKLSKERGDALEWASYNISSLENYMEELGDNTEEILQTTLLSLYKDAKTNYPGDQNLQFDYIKEKLYIVSDSEITVMRKKISDSTLIIMSKFFENCSIFESEEKKHESSV